ncbi:hypothetical protein LCGC14_0224730 [marine sediment metagenome]|uniref:Uncharacterized protein n=1 Tax=marine sediment metagenome TaxID=412755 RepID=A0A0F9UGW0_9ZZZZ|nr:hypothetical protein [bacterium]
MIPINCELCKKHLEDTFFIEKYKTKDVCEIDNKITSELLGFECEDFKLSKWVLVQYLEKLRNKK